MSRSEHGNARDKTDPHDVARKLRIKRLNLARRRAAGDAPSALVPIEVLDHGPAIHYPALADLHDLMARLPRGLLEGLGGIDLRLPPLHDLELDRALDPLVGRLAAELLPGVYAPPTLGAYLPRPARIELFAYVYEHADPILALYLRIQMLTAFVRELARHHEHACRTSRARWRDERAKEWVRTYVVRYVEETYPAELAALQRWLVTHGGVPLPLELICFDGDGPTLLATPFVGLVAAVQRGTPEIETKLDLAFNLHYAYHFETALEVIDHVLAVEPGHLDALRWRAHVFEHQGRYAEADAIARTILARDPTHAPSWWVLRANAIRIHDWSGLRAIVTRMLAIDAGIETIRARRDRFSHLYWRAWASLELGDPDAAERDKAALQEMAATLEETASLDALARKTLS